MGLLLAVTRPLVRVLVLPDLALDLLVVLGHLLGRLVVPADRVVVPGLGVEAREQPVEVLGVLELLVDDVRGVGVGHDVLAEVEVVLQHVVDQPAQPGDVGAGPDRHVDVGQGGGAGEPRVDVDDRRAAPLRLHHPLEADRVGLGHVRALDQDAVSVLQVHAGWSLRHHGRTRSPDRGPWRSVISAPGSRSGSRPSPCRASS